MVRVLTSKSKNSIILCENVYRRRRQCGGTAINFIKFKKLWNIQFFNLKRMWDRRKSISASSTWFSSTKFLFHFISTTSIHIFCFRSLLIFFHCCCYSYTNFIYFYIFALPSSLSSSCFDWTDIEHGSKKATTAVM